MLDKVEYTSEDIDSKLETILGKDNLDEKDIFKIHTFFSTTPEFKQLTMFDIIEEIELTAI